METKQIKIDVPQGYEIDREKSTFENIILKPIEQKLPTLLSEIKSLNTDKYNGAFAALRDLILLRDAWNGDWKADWSNGENKHCITIYKNKIGYHVNNGFCCTLNFKTRELAEKFLAQFEDLINEAKELI